MKLHRRTRLVEEAQGEFTMFLLDWIKKYKLTYGELFSILSYSMKDNAKYMIRAERHSGDPDKKGEEE